MFVNLIDQGTAGCRGAHIRRSACRVILASWPVLLVFVGGCEPSAPAVRAAATAELDRLVQWDTAFALEESSEVINVTPSVTFDPRGGYLVADFREHQVRRYSPVGALRWNVGRRGDGPGEFDRPSRIVRLPTGEVVAANFNRRFTFLSVAADSVLRTVETPFSRIEDIEVLNDSLILVSAILARDFASPRLHVWDVRNDTLIRSFFDPYETAPNKTAASVAGWSMAAVRGDTIAAIFSVSDSVYLYTIAGERLAVHALPSKHFRSVPEEAPDPNIDPQRRAQWLGTFDYMSDVHWLAAGELLVLYKSLVPSEALTPEWHMVIMDASGEGLYEVRDLPRLLAAKSEAAVDELLFVSPSAEVPNQWVRASLLPH